MQIQLRILGSWNFFFWPFRSKKTRRLVYCSGQHFTKRQRRRTVLYNVYEIHYQTGCPNMRYNHLPYSLAALGDRELPIFQLRDSYVSILLERRSSQPQHRQSLQLKYFLLYTADGAVPTSILRTSVVDGVQGFDDQYWKKFSAERYFLQFTYQGRPSYRRSLLPSE